MFKSEIRESTINQLLEKASNRNYGKYLSKLVLKKLRGFVNEPVSFDFPVTALIGPNGGGKTTVLGAAGCAYRSISPGRFFAKSGAYDESMQDWSIEYEIIDRDTNSKSAFRRTSSFKNLRWNREPVERNVLLFGVNRTVPANERKELLKCASSHFSVPEQQIDDIPTAVVEAVSRILGKDTKGFRKLRIDENGRVALLTGKTKGGSGYSEFHFGAGESSIIRMVSEIELAEEQALILIEEIENGLHPVATIRMVEYLVDAAERKKIQAIFTTHSNDALRPLPSKAIWVATQDRIFQGKLDVQSLRAITGQVEAKLVCFVEDSFAKLWVEAIIRQIDKHLIEQLEVHAMEGDGTAVAINKYHNIDPSNSKKSICIIDGDSKQTDSEEQSVFRLPGESPEAYVFDAIVEAWGSVGGKVSVAIMQRFENARDILETCNTIRITCIDPHLLFSQLGEKLGLISEATVATAFVNLWAQAYPELANKIVAPIKKLIATG